MEEVTARNDQHNILKMIIFSRISNCRAKCGWELEELNNAVYPYSISS